MPSANQRLRLFKISKRRDMDISTVTFAFLATIENDRIVDARVAVGGVGPQVMRIAPVEGFLRSKPWALETLTDAGRMLCQHVAPWTDVRGGADYRCQLVENLMIRSFYPSDVSDNVEQ
jgi:xanthine dehydrogenase small subunit